jgi:hypothetical protein
MFGYFFNRKHPAGEFPDNMYWNLSQLFLSPLGNDHRIDHCPIAPYYMGTLQKKTGTNTYFKKTDRHERFARWHTPLPTDGYPLPTMLHFYLLNHDEELDTLSFAGEPYVFI